MPLHLDELGGEIICQKDAFLCGARGIQIEIAFRKRIGVGLFGGEGFIMQRLRGDVIALDKDLQTETTFPDREDAEQSYKLSEDYKKLFRKVLGFASELVSDESGTRRNRRVRWWSALALLRAMASSQVSTTTPPAWKQASRPRPAVCSPQRAARLLL